MKVSVKVDYRKYRLKIDNSTHEPYLNFITLTNQTRGSNNEKNRY